MAEYSYHTITRQSEQFPDGYDRGLECWNGNLSLGSYFQNRIIAIRFVQNCLWNDSVPTEFEQYADMLRVK